MNTLLLIAAFFALVATGAWIWLLVRGFKTSALWGFGILLLSPISAIFFGVYYWEKQREPFLLYTTTITAMYSLLIYMFTVSGGMEAVRIAYNLQQGGMSQNMSEDFKREMMHANFSVEQKSILAEMFQQDPDFFNSDISEENSEELDAETPTEETAEIKEKPVRHRLTYVPVKLSEIQKYIGTTAKVTRKNVEEKEYLITGASPRHIEVAQRSRSGNFSFHFKNSDIEKIRVLINEAY